MPSRDSASRSAAPWGSWRWTTCALRPSKRDLGASANVEATTRAAVASVAALTHVGAGHPGDEFLHSAAYTGLDANRIRHRACMSADDEAAIRPLDVDLGTELAEQRGGKARARGEGG